MLDMKFCLLLNVFFLGMNLHAGEYWIAVINAFGAVLAVMTLHTSGEL